MEFFSDVYVSWREEVAQYFKEEERGHDTHMNASINYMIATPGVEPILGDSGSSFRIADVGALPESMGKEDT